MALAGGDRSWDYALKLERERGGLGAFMFATARVEELEVAGDMEQLALWRNVWQRITDLHSLDTRTLH